MDSIANKDATSRILKGHEKSLVNQDDLDVIDLHGDLQDILQEDIDNFTGVSANVDDSNTNAEVQALLAQVQTESNVNPPKKEEQKDDGQKQDADNPESKDGADGAEGAEEQQAKTAEPAASANPQEDRDKRSVFVQNVHFSADKKEIEQFFADSDCKVNAITILKDNLTRQPKGLCYVEFENVDVAQNALQLNGTLFKGRQITIQPKRTNTPGRHRAKPFVNPVMQFLNMMQRGGGPRGRGRGGFPYSRGGRGRGGPPRGGFNQDRQQQGDRTGGAHQDGKPFDEQSKAQ